MIAILICHLPKRKHLIARLLRQIDNQRQGFNDVRVLIDPSLQHTTGEKRNRLLDKARAAKADYVAFVDDDDLLGPNYVKLSRDCVESGADVMELYGQYWEGRTQHPIFHHSLQYKEWHQDKNGYYRNPNHLNLTKLSCLENIRYKNLTIGEDGQYSLALAAAGVLKTEHKINEIIYYYFSGQRLHDQEMSLALNRGTKIQQ